MAIAAATSCGCAAEADDVTGLDAPLSGGVAGPTVATLGQNRDILVDGRPFFPLCVYHVSSVSLAARLGFNCAQYWFSRGETAPTAAAISFMRDGLARGVYTVVEYSDHVRSGEIANMRAMAGKLATQPGVILSYAVDEPHYGGLAARSDKAACDALVRSDPNHLCFVLDERDAIVGFADAASILGLDHYPVRWTGGRYGFPGQTGDSLASVGNLLEVVRDAAGPGKPVWFAVQAHRIPSDAFYPDSPRWPTPAEVRAMAYLALNHGATGLLFYAGDDVYGDFKSGFEHDPTLMTFLPTLMAELREMGPRYTYGSVVRLDSGSEIDLVRIDHDGITLVAVNPTARTLEGNVPGIGTMTLAPHAVYIRKD